MDGKVCTRCNVWKPFSQFHRRKAKLDGHKSECKLCFGAYEKRYFAQNPDKLKTKKDRHEKMRSNLGPEWTAKSIRYYWKNSEERKAYRRKYCKDNRGKCNADGAKYKTALLQRIPKWANLREIEEFYKKCPAGYHVDHTVPLRGRFVSGLHVLNNLQYLPASDNLKKKNKFDLQLK